MLCFTPHHALFLSTIQQIIRQPRCTERDFYPQHWRLKSFHKKLKLIFPFIFHLFSFRRGLLIRKARRRRSVGGLIKKCCLLIHQIRSSWCHSRRERSRSKKIGFICIFRLFSVLSAAPSTWTFSYRKSGCNYYEIYVMKISLLISNYFYLPGKDLRPRRLQRRNPSWMKSFWLLSLVDGTHVALIISPRHIILRPTILFDEH